MESERYQFSMMSYALEDDITHPVKYFQGWFWWLSIITLVTRRAACHHLLDTAERMIAREGEEQVRSSETIVRQLNKYIEQHLSEDLSLIRLAEIARFNPQYLSRLYKQVMGIGISERILELRLTEAKRLLDETQLKVQDIAVKIGFQSAPYFTRFFKKQTGLTPNEYRTRRTLI